MLNFVIGVWSQVIFSTMVRLILAMDENVNTQFITSSVHRDELMKMTSTS